ncbi:MAG: CehA/McbA family metallohydrolase [Candidatus Puniceispirillaceae bacterium]
MTSLAPFNLNKPFLRGNLHGHSTHSDGRLSPDEVAKRYYDLGYDFICISDHLWNDDRFASTRVLDARNLDKPDFITIPSAELHCFGKAYDNDGLWHIVANGLPVDFAVATKTESAPQMVQRAIEAGAYVTIAHPEWYSMTTQEADSLHHAHGVEIYNHSCVMGSNRGSGIAIADYLLQEGHKMSFTATDDSHFFMDDYGGGYVMVASDLNQQAIIEALRSGHHYASSGVSIFDISLQGHMLTVSCSPAEHIILSGAGHSALSAHGPNKTRAQFDLSNWTAAWFRVTIIGKDGARAWSNPYWLADLPSIRQS